MEELKGLLVDMKFGTAFKIGVGLTLGSLAVIIVPYAIIIIIVVALGIAAGA